MLEKAPKEANDGDIRLNRRLRTLYRCNSVFFQAQSEQELLQPICEILVADGDLRVAWIGYCENDAERTVRPVARAGYDLDILDEVKISWGGIDSGQHPAGMAVQTGKPCCVNDIQTDPRVSPWRSAAIAHGFNSCIALPLVVQTTQRGVVDLRGALSLYSAEPQAFDESATEYYAELAACLTRALTVLRDDLATDLAHDVTALRATQERKRSEQALREARADLTRVTQVMAMGEMAASIAHEINQPLAAIVANGNAGLRWLANETPEVEEARAVLKRIVSDGHRASDVVSSIRESFKKGARDNEMLDINGLIREILAVLHEELKSQRVSIQGELAETLPQIPANRVQLQQVIVNLITNAVEAMSSVVNRTRVLRVESEIDESNNVVVVVEDSGIGIDPKNIDRIFDAFFTTKTHGMGLGLSICRSIIEAHGGSLSASSGDPHGSVFRAVLPTAGPAASS
jgi:C4-dicarboxylate-specific signal transduction histidine kinase